MPRREAGRRSKGLSRQSESRLRVYISISNQRGFTDGARSRSLDVKYAPVSAVCLASVQPIGEARASINYMNRRYG